MSQQQVTCGGKRAAARAAVAGSAQQCARYVARRCGSIRTLLTCFLRTTILLLRTLALLAPRQQLWWIRTRIATSPLLWPTAAACDMKLCPVLVVLAAGCAVSAPVNNIGRPAVFFVSPGGSDAGAGTNLSTPFATLERAVFAAREQTAGATIRVLDGVHSLRAPVKITAAESGPGRPLTLQGTGNGVLSGGVLIKGWTWHSNAGLWKAPIPPEFSGNATMRQLFVGGERLQRPKVPARGALNVTAAADLASFHPTPAPNSSALVGYVSSDLSVRSWQPGQVEGVYNGTAQEWCEHRCGVAKTVALNSTATLIIMQQPCFELAMTRSGWRTSTPSATGVGLPNYWENVHGALAPGEWSLNASAHTVDVMPLRQGPAGNPELLGAISPLTETLLHLLGTANVHVEGLRLEHAAWHLSRNTGYVSTQAGTWVSSDALGTEMHGGLASWHMMPSALLVESSSDITIKHCTVTRLGGAGITIANGSSDCTVASCSFTDISGSAIQLAGTAFSNGVEEEGLRIDKGSQAQKGLVCVNNTITNLPRE